MTVSEPKPNQAVGLPDRQLVTPNRLFVLALLVVSAAAGFSLAIVLLAILSSKRKLAVFGMTIAAVATIGDQNPTVLFLANSLIGSVIAYVACAAFFSTAYYPQLWTVYTLVTILVFCRQRIGRTPPLRQANESAMITGATA